jgi:hypothetical protein
MSKNIKITVTMEKQDAREAILLGFHSNWISGSDDEGKYELSTGAGMGSPWLRAKIGENYYAADMRKFFTELIEKARAS